MDSREKKAGREPAVGSRAWKRTLVQDCAYGHGAAGDFTVETIVEAIPDVEPRAGMGHLETWRALEALVRSGDILVAKRGAGEMPTRYRLPDDVLKMVREDMDIENEPYHSANGTEPPGAITRKEIRP